LLSKIKIRSLNVYAQVLNPFLFTGYKGVDPDVAGADAANEIYPRYRTFLPGCKISVITLKNIFDMKSIKQYLQKFWPVGLAVILLQGFSSCQKELNYSPEVFRFGAKCL